jgi:hypothetical protein
MQSAVQNAECRVQRLQNAVYFEHRAASIIRLRLRQYADVRRSSTQPSLHALLLCVNNIEDRQLMQLRMYTSSFDDNVAIASEKGITIEELEVGTQWHAPCSCTSIPNGCITGTHGVNTPIGCSACTLVHWRTTPDSSTSRRFNIISTSCS